MNQKDLDREYPYSGVLLNGFLMLFILLIFAAGAALLVATVNPWCIGLGVILGLFVFVSLAGFFTQQPNQALVMIFFGKYRGTYSGSGFYWINPFMTCKEISLRIRNLDVEPIKVNDKIGNPVMIGMVLVWKVSDTYRAVFDVDSESTGTGVNKLALENFVAIQSDAALREVTGRFAYDDDDKVSDEPTLRSGNAQIVELLEAKLNERLAMAGIQVIEARLNYLAYAPEIAAVMLRRQQASAIISAREKIVEGAVSMVRMALTELSEQGVVELDEERKATMVSNLLVVLCADEPAQPVVNTGSLYN